MGDRKLIKAIDLEGETWKNVVGFEGLYMVSNKQRVKSMKRPSLGDFTIPERILRPGKHISGYSRLTLCKDGKLHYFNLHRLVAEAFIPNPNKYPCINHIDNDPTNNSIENLEWCTFSMNTRHAYGTGRLSKAGSKNSMAKLTEANVLEIFASSDKKSKELALMYNVDQQSINDIRAGRRWGWLTGKVHPKTKKRIIDTY